MQAIILAAGQGRRLRDPQGRPKCLREVGGSPLVHHQVRALAQAGVDDVSIVVGHQHEQVRSAVGPLARYVTNPCFAETNSMFSFLLARPVIHDDVIVMNSDLFFDPSLIPRLLEGEDDALLYDSDSGEDDEEMKVEVVDGHLARMAKDLHPDRVSGENVGILRLSCATALATIRAARTIAAEGGRRAWLAAAINRITPDHRIRCRDVSGSSWVEIDFPEDLHRARTEVLPEIAAALGLRERDVVGASPSGRNL
jgi:choline kinase